MNALKENRDGWRRKGFGNRISRMALLALAGFQLAGGGKALGQGADVSEKFPELSQVQADYPDEADRYTAFQVLDRALRIAAPRPVSKPAYNKLFTYEAADNGLDNLHMVQGMQSQAYRDWVARRDGVLTNVEFARSVLAKYQLAAYAHAPRQAPVDSPDTTANGQPAARAMQPNQGASARPFTPLAYMASPARIHQAFFAALPIGALCFRYAPPAFSWSPSITRISAVCSRAMKTAWVRRRRRSRSNNREPHCGHRRRRLGDGPGHRCRTALQA